MLLTLGVCALIGAGLFARANAADTIRAQISDCVDASASADRMTGTPEEQWNTYADYCARNK